MKRIGIEETLLEYFKVTGKDWQYSIQYIDNFPKDIIEIRSVCINNKHIHFCEEGDLNNFNSIIYWTLDATK
ncbi:hypothetical protein [Aquimarina algicola]|uniref:Uncharacterized protein n=1 Tax=Aquimarina algicola TaxID=2589995 RepID=A0A504J955_9FLAO|nr:hypothetical protein [Aquimarina algicola]TPN87144.1 hypothetical protein FHK87_06010 [Aquimarina algicola]